MLVVTVLAALGQFGLTSWLGMPMGFVPAYPAVMVAAWYGGWWAGALVTGVLALLLPALAGAAWNEPTQVAVGLILLFGLLNAALSQSLRHARERSQERAEALSLSQQRLSGALESTGVMLLEFDPALCCTWLYNPPPGVDAAALLGRPAEALCAPADAERLRAALRQVLDSGEPQRIDVTLRAGAPGEAARCHEHCIVALRDEAGRTCGLRSAASDVSALRSQQAREAEVQALFRAAQERSPDAFELVRAVREGDAEDGQVVDFVWEYANPAAATLLGRSAEALVGQRLLGERADRFQRARFAHWCEVLSAGEPRRGEFRRDELGRSTCNYQTLALPLGERLSVMTVDATVPTRNLEAEREQSAALQRAAALKDDFLAHLSHELRTPLNAITGWAHLLTRVGADPALLQRAAEAIGRNAHAQAVLVDALLDMNRVVSGSLRLERQPCDLSEALQRSLATAAPLAQAKWIRLHTDDIATGVPCNGDSARLEQVFGNLLSNAVKFTPLGGDVWVVLEPVDGNTALIEIRDSGEGVAPAVLPHFFDRFQQRASGTRSHAGLGLGLTMVKSLVELHGGRASVHSDGPGLGTTVRLHLPTLEQPGARANAAPARPAATDGAAAGSPVNGTALEVQGAAASHAAPLTFRRILVLEDEADSLEVLSVLLRQQGAVVRAFDNAEQALAAAEHGSFDLVISDLGMPGMNGLEFMRRLQRRPLPVKAIALTAYAGETERAEALKAGYTRVETKPISPPQFLAVVLAEVGTPAAG
ncbi:MAG: response regulator [Methylibium sp.]|uniref:hybrid sensor histidine kinase/response regulator n=1 Tax=Methylibium sp. TaxID=2067992 RepID=UPI0017E30C6F|nr:ATP-binding protein [Methylibium sp.]MBA3596910.1 response regulator [Methylibium sp.]